MAVQSTMRAVIHNQKLSSLTLKSVRIPRPNLEAGEHLLRVHAVALTRWELLWPRPAPLDTAYSPGVEMCGTVVTAPAASKFTQGTRVYMRTTYPRDASTRDYTIGLASELAKVPTYLTDEEAAAVPVSALTAWQGLFVHGGSDFEHSQNKRILVNGAAGGVGMWYVQLAKAAGMDVTGTCTPASTERVKATGAEINDYTTTDLREWKDEKFDLVVDCVGGKSRDDTWFAVKDGGLVLSIVPPKDMNWKFVLDRPEGASESVQGKFFVMESNGEDLAKISKLIEEGKVKPTIDSLYRMEEFQKAFERADSGKTAGKVVIRIREDE